MTPNRQYNPKIGRWTQEDPICAGLNWYTYCENDPVNRIDPWGLDSYILYDPNPLEDNNFVTLEKAELMALELKDIYGKDHVVHLIAISSGQDLIDRWNGVDKYGLGFDAKGNVVTIDAVVIYAHGSAGDYGFGGKDGNWTARSTWFTFSDIDKLDKKSMDMLISISCNTAGSHVADNFAAAFMRTQPGIKNVIAADGNVCVGINSTTTKPAWWQFWKKPVTTRTTDIYTVQGKRTDSPAGYMLYSRDSKGNVVSSPIGSFGDHYSGLNGLIRAAGIK